jgi:type IV pilus assembly protein PilN
MIKINLLGAARPKVKAKAVPLETRLQIFLLILCLLAAGGWLALRYLTYKSDLQKIQTEIAKKEADKVRMAQLQKEIDQFERRKKLLQSRIDVIETLRKNQSGPFLLLDGLASTVNRTDSLWLTNLEQKGNKLTIEGMAGSVNSVANFITNLKRSGLFKDIEIKESYQDDKTPGVSNFVFSLIAELAQAQPPA